MTAFLVWLGEGRTDLTSAAPGTKSVNDNGRKEAGTVDATFRSWRRAAANVYARRGAIRIQSMRIAQVAPLYEAVPPQAYGATKCVDHSLTEALVWCGHHVTLFATADSTTSAEHIPQRPRGLWRDAKVWDTLAHHVRELEVVAQRAARSDVIHFHGDSLHFPVGRRLACAHVTTMHGQLLAVDHGPLLRY